MFTVRMEPIGKPRQTRRDVWQLRPVVARYRAFADQLRLEAQKQLIEWESVGTLCVTAYFSVPPSWPKSKKADMANQPHRQTPDADNVIKAVMDALFPRDEGIHCISLMKRWDDGNGARLEITVF